MGNGVIAGGGDKGLYTLTMDFGTVRRDSIKSAYEQRIAQLAAKLPEWEAKSAEFDAEVSAARAGEGAAVRLYIESMLLQAPEETSRRLRDDLTSARRRVLLAEASKMSVETTIEALRAEIRGFELQIAELMSRPTIQTAQVWCADRTEDAEPGRTVATIEIPGEPQSVLIAPKCRWWSNSDGALLARHAMTPAQAFFNAAILPGWQKHKPTYRVGVITSVNQDDTVNVALDPAASSAQGLDVNKTASLSNVPVTYMHCNCGAFASGDRVVVQFEWRSWLKPRVIGFASNPKPCMWSCVQVLPGKMHLFECGDPDVMDEIAAPSGVVVQYRINRAQWKQMRLIQVITTPRSPDWIAYQWADPAPYVNNNPILYIERNLVQGDVSIDGITVAPFRALNGHNAPAIAEFLVTKNGATKANIAFRWNPEDDSTTLAEVLSPGGINIKMPTSIEVRRLEGYALFSKTGD